MEAWLVLLAGVGSGLLGGFCLAFSLVVMPALRRRPAGEAASAMIVVNRAAARRERRRRRAPRARGP